MLILAPIMALSIQMAPLGGGFFTLSGLIDSVTKGGDMTDKRAPSQQLSVFVAENLVG